MGAVGKLIDPRPVQVLYTVSATYAQPSTSRDVWRFGGDQGDGHGATHCGVTTETVLMKFDTLLD